MLLDLPHPQELCLVIPGARRLNRGRAEVGALVSACRAAGVTDLLVVHETRGQPGKMWWGLGKGVGPREVPCAEGNCVEGPVLGWERVRLMGGGS